MGDDTEDKRVDERRVNKAGLQTASGRVRVQTAVEKHFHMCHESHHALIKLVDFLDSAPFGALIKSIALEAHAGNPLYQKQAIDSVLEQYAQVLREARTVREHASNCAEEFQRSIIDMTPMKPDEARRLHE